jgi:hypothetical protein
MSDNINITSTTTTSYVNEVVKNIVAIEQPSNLINISTGVSTPAITGDYVQNNDPRLSDDRNPLPHSQTHHKGSTDPITPEDIGAQPSGDYVLTSDPRLSDERDPKSHSRNKINDLEYLLFPGSNINITYDSINFRHTISSLSTVSSVDPKSVAKAWISFNGTGVVSIINSYNIESIIDNGFGNYTINFQTPMENANYSFLAWSRDWNTDNTIINGVSARSNTSKTSTSLSILNHNIINGFNYDSPEINIVVFGD